MVNKPDTIQFPVVDPATGEYMMLVKRKRTSNASNERLYKVLSAINQYPSQSY